jgi:hypothetical protein
MTLTEFLLARTAEDEAVALGLLAKHSRQYQHSGPAAEVWSDSDDNEVEGVSLSPTRMVAECEARRRIVEHHGQSVVEGDLCSICTEVGPDAQGWPCLTLRLLALPYSDHEDYDEAWRP